MPPLPPIPSRVVLPRFPTSPADARGHMATAATASHPASASTSRRDALAAASSSSPSSSASSPPPRHHPSAASPSSSSSPSSSTSSPLPRHSPSAVPPPSLLAVLVDVLASTAPQPLRRATAPPPRHRPPSWPPWTPATTNRPVLLHRVARATRGKRITKLLEDEIEQDEVFWNQGALKDEVEDEGIKPWMLLVYCDKRGRFWVDPETVAALQLVKGPVGVVSVCAARAKARASSLTRNGASVLASRWLCDLGPCGI